MLDSDAQLAELREQGLRAFVFMAGIAYGIWHASAALSDSAETVTRAYAVFPAAATAFGGAYLLLKRSLSAASWWLVVAGHLAIAWAAWVMQDPRATILHAALTLAAAFLLGLRGGIASGVLGVGLGIAVALSQRAVVDAADLWIGAATAALAVGGVWIVTSRLLLALSWYSQSFAIAERRTREAREHRAELVETTRQLDHALYQFARANEALRVAWQIADQAERSRMELATNISHEFRTPLNLIVGYSEMMLTSPGSYRGASLPPAYRVDVNAVYRSAQHLLALAEDVLDLARMETGSVGLLREPADLGEIIRDAATLVRDYVAAKGLELRLDLEAGLPPLMVDRLRVRQVLLNLLTNAARVTERGHVAVTLRRRDELARVDIADTGPGIPSADLVRIFQRFERGDANGAEDRRGTGLGLPISRRFIELHGGAMGVESVAGAGATFWFTLPLAAMEHTVLAPRSGAALSGRGGANPIVVLASQESELVRVLQRHLEGFDLETACDLASARRRAEESKAIAILADMDAPFSDAEDSAVPVVRCPLPSVRRLARRLGVAEYLIKPVSRESLVQAIGRLGRPIESILVVDDVPWFAELLTRMLTADGQRYDVAIAHTGDEAMSRLRGHRPDLMLLDLAIPNLDGAGVLAQVADDPALRDTSIIVISAHAEGEGNLPLGGEVRVEKPEGFRLTELMRVLDATLRQMAPPRAHVEPTAPAPPAGAPG
jgi:signal transduction histidine kinase/CheY-like chemotaxis protein